MTNTDILTPTKKTLDQAQICVVGLGYVGLPLAVAFAEKGLKVIGFDVNKAKVEKYRSGIDVTDELGDEVIAKSKVDFTYDPTKIKVADIVIVAVPTPINEHKTPDLYPLISASELVGKNLKPGAIVCFESTVYPGATEDDCVPVIEKHSGLKCGVDFKVGYSPERVSPGEKNRTLKDIVKVVSGMDQPTLECLAQLYGKVVDAGIYQASSIKVAEAAKVIENTQRDINIAFMNELSVIFDRLKIDTQEVLKAAGTKWNFLKFYPGLVGGHCIGVDPYYLAHKAAAHGYHPEILLAGRRLNDAMGPYVATQTVKHMIANGRPIKGGHVLVLGITFKENVADIRNSKIVDTIHELKSYGINVHICDPRAHSEEVHEEYGLNLTTLDKLPKLDAIILAVAHEEYQKLKAPKLKELCHENSVLVDLKALINPKEAQDLGFTYWRL